MRSNLRRPCWDKYIETHEALSCVFRLTHLKLVSNMPLVGHVVCALEQKCTLKK
jgi:hypothetical protein